MDFYNQCLGDNFVVKDFISTMTWLYSNEVVRSWVLVLLLESFDRVHGPCMHHIPYKV